MILGQNPCSEELRIVENNKCKIKFLYKHNKRLIFLREFDIDDLEQLRNEIKNTYIVVDLELAPFKEPAKPETSYNIFTF